MPYAIIRAGGHQEKVTPGEQITVDRMKQDVGAEVTFAPLVVSKDDGTLVSDKSELGEATVVAKVLQHIKADKVEIFQYRQKTGYRRRQGHRQPQTLLEIAEIRLGGEVFTAPEPAVEEPAPAADEAGAEKKPSGKKSTAKKSTAKKSTAKKSTAKGGK